MASPIVHFEIGSPDSGALAEFYSEVFDWKFLDIGAIRPVVGGHEGGPTGLLNTLGHPPHNYVLIYIQVDDIDLAIAQSSDHGGKLLVGPGSLPDGRRFAWISDPVGNTIGLLTPLPTNG